jgi:hypothetical protein
LQNFSFKAAGTTNSYPMEANANEQRPVVLRVSLD